MQYGLRFGIDALARMPKKSTRVPSGNLDGDGFGFEGDGFGLGLAQPPSSTTGATTGPGDAARAAQAANLVISSEAIEMNALPSSFAFGFEESHQTMSSYTLPGGHFGTAKAPLAARFSPATWQNADTNVIRQRLADWPKDADRAPRPTPAPIPEVNFHFFQLALKNVTSDGVSCTSTSISAWQCGFLQAPPRLRHKVGGHPALQLIAIPDTLDGVGQTNTANKQLISNEALRLVLQKFVDVGDGCIVNNYPGEEGPVRIIPYLEVHSADYSEIVS